MANKITPEIEQACLDWEVNKIISLLDFNNELDVRYIFKRVAKSISAQRENLQEQLTSLLSYLLTAPGTPLTSSDALAALDESYSPISKSMAKDEIRYNIFGRLFFCQVLIFSYNDEKILEKCLNITLELAQDRSYVHSTAAVLLAKIHAKQPNLINEIVVDSFYKIVKEFNADLLYLILATDTCPLELREQCNNLAAEKSILQPFLNGILLTTRNVHPALHPIWELLADRYAPQLVLDGAKELLYSNNDKKFQALLVVAMMLKRDPKAVLSNATLLQALEAIAASKNDLYSALREFVFSQLTSTNIELIDLKKFYEASKCPRIISIAASAHDAEKVLNVFDDDEFLSIYSAICPEISSVAKKILLNKPENSPQRIFETLAERPNNFSELFEALKDYKYTFSSQIKSQQHQFLKERINSTNNESIKNVLSLIWLRFSSDPDNLNDVVSDLSSINFEDANTAILSILIHFLNIPSKIYRRFSEVLLAELIPKLNRNQFALINSALFGVDETLIEAEEDSSDEDEEELSLSDFSEQESESSSESSETVSEEPLDMDDNAALGELYDARAVAVLKAKKIAAGQVEARTTNNKHFVQFLIDYSIKNIASLNSWIFFNALLDASYNSTNNDSWTNSINKLSKNFALGEVADFDEVIEEASSVPEHILASNRGVQQLAIEVISLMVRLLDSSDADFMPLVADIVEPFLTVKRISIDEKDIKKLLRKCSATRFVGYLVDCIVETINNDRIVSPFIFVKAIEIMALAASSAKIPTTENLVAALLKMNETLENKRRRSCSSFVVKIVSSLDNLDSTSKEALKKLIPAFPALKKYLY